MTMDPWLLCHLSPVCPSGMILLSRKMFALIATKSSLNFPEICRLKMKITTRGYYNNLLSLLYNYYAWEEPSNID